MNNFPQNAQTQPPTVDDLFKKTLTTGPHGGTPLTNLNNNKKQKYPQQYDNYPQQNPEPQYSSQQYPQQYTQQKCQQPKKQKTNEHQKYKNQNKKIKNLVNDIHSSLKKVDTKIDELTEQTESSVEDEKNNDIEQESNSTWDKIYTKMISFVKDAVIIIIVYMILSQGFVKRTISSYIPQIIPVDDQVPILGQLIYAVLLSSIATLPKMFLN
jgi:hypothetical protein